MRRVNIYMILAVFPIAIALAFPGCAKKSAEYAKIIARVSNKYITLGDFNSKIEKLPSYYRDMVKHDKKKFLDETIMEMMFYEEAIRQGLDKDKEVVDILAEARKKILITKLVKNEVDDKVKVDEAEIRQFYESNKENFKSQEMWRASHILVPTESEAREVEAELSKGAKFEDLARARSTDATASRGGDVGYFRKGQLIPEFEEAALKLGVGQTSPIIHTRFGYHIIKLTDVKKPTALSYEEIKPRIEDDMKKTKRFELFNDFALKLRNKYNVAIEDDAIKYLEDKPVAGEEEKK